MKTLDQRDLGPHPAMNALAPAPSTTDLAATIDKISEGMKALLASGLNEYAIIVLLQDETKVCRRDVCAVLSGLKELKKSYTSK